ncbi:6-phosphogluconate dehydrogenase, NAD-binding [Caballeronia arationis]|jgi:3-hydroxyisobutyrate dehydrogenase-like beta-hydroxyacid dehydrogenase|uniref:NAD(P)-dependent oxidoreductase n=1 Tax=Caballeronia arationis TaxID=1777142 RepID=UPI00074BD5D3|nr:DUF1932 domain-containing protein [Caballeronia arationis]SAK63564.1 6-phosphogluconate dehydrogenase, NAD-binding [Caballeronia arationis]
MTGKFAKITRVAIIGFGEAGGVLGAALAEKGVQVSMYDVRLDALREKAARAGVRAADTVSEAIGDAQLIVSAVTAQADIEVAGTIAAHIAPGQVCFDINSVSPQTKRHAQFVIEATGAHYVEAAVMAPVPPYGIEVPMLLGGIEAESVGAALNELGFRTRTVSAKIGVASAAKMSRSVMIKGIEALTVECLRAARHYDAEAIVLESLRDTFARMQHHADLPGYLVSRVAEHGRRRAAEMREVAETLRDADVEPFMSEASARLQDEIVDQMERQGMDYGTLPDPFDWREFFARLS